MLGAKTKWLKSREEWWEMDRGKWSTGIQMLKLLDMNINIFKETDDKWKILSENWNLL